MKITILNDCFFTSEHIARLKSLGELTIYNNTNNPELALTRSKDAEVLILDQFLTQYDSKLLEGLSNVKFIAINTTSFSQIDIKKASELGIKVSNVPGFSSRSTAELTIGMMFAVIRQIVRGDKYFRSHPIDDLDPASDFGKSFIGYEVFGKTIGIIGMGRIGKIVAEIASLLGMKVLSYSRTPSQINGVNNVDLRTLLEQSDIVSLHVPLNAETRNIISEKELEQMKSGSILLNISSSKLVDPDALFKYLKSEKLRGAGLDVVDIKEGHPLLELGNVVFTPHVGSYTKEAFEINLPGIIVSNVENYVKGDPQNIVN